jgi:putative transposase
LAVFRDAEDYRSLLGWLREGARKFQVAIHAYALMPSQWSILATPADQEGLGRLMQWVGRYYVPYFNRKYGRNGTLWQGRYKATVIDAQRYFMNCSRYMELSPVAEGLAAEPLDYPWSSFAHHIGARQDPLITDHSLYWGLGNTPFAREAAYKKIMEQALTAEELALWTASTRTDWALGSEKFKIDLEKQVKRRVSPGKRGRPAKVVGAKL